jgi:hypothetical protein
MRRIETRVVEVIVCPKCGFEEKEKSIEERRSK